nr:ATP-dependent sacrificial sulfur transferase LarE [uncultured Desulfobulbus sp.]
MNHWNHRQNCLLTILEEKIDQDCIIAFSGGVDSALLAQAASLCAQQKGHRVHAVTFQTALHPLRDLELTQTLAQELGLSHQVIEVDELRQAKIENNPKNRCYLCKKYLFTQLRSKAQSMGISLIMDGTNADDLQAYRPGIQALRELDIFSPLAEAGMTKEDVRAMAATYKLRVAARPSTPCLATRFPYNTPLCAAQMRAVEQGEALLRSLGMHNIRLRVHGDIVRIEIDPEAFPLLTSHREEIVAQLKLLGFTYITLDLEGFRSGSMDSSPRLEENTI